MKLEGSLFLIGGFLVKFMNRDINGAMNIMSLFFFLPLYGTKNFLILLHTAHMCVSFLSLHIQESGPLNIRNRILKRRKEGGQTNQKQTDYSSKKQLQLVDG